jgi:hypothetical protein
MSEDGIPAYEDAVYGVVNEEMRRDDTKRNERATPVDEGGDAKVRTRFRHIAIFEGFFSISVTVCMDPPRVSYSSPAISEVDQCPSENPHRLNPDVFQVHTSVIII